MQKYWKRRHWTVSDNTQIETSKNLLYSSINNGHYVQQWNLKQSKLGAIVSS